MIADLDDSIKQLLVQDMPVKNGEIETTLNYLEGKWREFEKFRPFDYSLLCDDLADLPRSDRCG